MKTPSIDQCYKLAQQHGTTYANQHVLFYPPTIYAYSIDLLEQYGVAQFTQYTKTLRECRELLSVCRDVTIESGAYESYGAVRQAFNELEALLASIDSKEDPK
jgi:hypothetical protein